MFPPIFIIGLPGTGKTTQGRAIARCIGLTFYDLDFCIEQRYHASVSEIFREKGEEEFRRIEGMMLREIGEFDDVVVSCGGGTPCHNDNMDYMNSRGITVRLNVSPSELAERIERNPGKRPLFSDKVGEELLNSINALAAQREPYYSRARIKLEIDSGRRLHKKSPEIIQLQQLLNETLR